MNSERDTGGPAFPSHGNMGEVTHEGMDLRDYIAIKELQVLTAQYTNSDWAESTKEFRDLPGRLGIAVHEFNEAEHKPLCIALRAYDYADAVLKVRKL